MPAPVLTSLTLPSRVNLTHGSNLAKFGATAYDTDGIDQIMIYFDRDFNYAHGEYDSSFSRYSFIGLWGIYDDWSDGIALEDFLIPQTNYSGYVDIEKIVVTDRLGYETTYTTDQLREAGFQTGFEITGTQDFEPQVSYVSSSADKVVYVREGTSATIDLSLIGEGYFHYDYTVTAAGGSAGQADLANGSGSHYFASAGSIDVAALRDNRTEESETGYITVNLSGATFADGGTQKVIEVRIVDDNMVTGTNAANSLRGTSAADNLQGLGGNDNYFVNAGDRVVELTDQGNDSVNSSISWKLSDNVENLKLTGTSAVNGTGNGLANTLTGNTADNTLDGLEGADTLVGGRGNDTYIVDAADTIIESADAGIDKVNANFSISLTANVENLRLTGTAAINGAGNSLANRMDGNSANNKLSGFSGNDSLYGGDGVDILTGGFGKDLLSGGDDDVRDVFVFNLWNESTRGAGRDQVTFFTSGIDDIDLRGMDANRALDGDQAFAWGGAKAIKNGVWITDTGRDIIVSGDVTGDGKADFEIEVSRIDSLSKGDFWL